MIRPLAVLAGLALLGIASVDAAQARDWVAVGGDGKFAVQMPGAPKEDASETQTPAGREVVHTYTIDDGEAAIYALSYSDLDAPRGAPQQFLKDSEARVIATAKATVRTSREIALGNWPGRYLVADTASGLVYTSRTYIVGRRFYQLVVFSTKAGATKPSVGKFLDSFKILAE